LAIATRYQLDATAFDALVRISEQLGLAQERRRHARQFYSASELGQHSSDRLTLFGQQFVRGECFAVHTEPASADAEANLKAIAEARRQCDWLVFSFHSHEFGDAGRHSAESDVGLTEPGRFAVDFARAAIDAGAD